MIMILSHGLGRSGFIVNSVYSWGELVSITPRCCSMVAISVYPNAVLCNYCYSAMSIPLSHFLDARSEVVELASV